MVASADVPSAAVSEQAAPESSADKVPPRTRQTFWLGVGAGAVALVLVLALGAGAIFLARRWISEGSAARPRGSPPAAPAPAKVTSVPSPAAPAPPPVAPPPAVAVDPPYTCEHAAELIDQRRYAEALACLDKVEGTAGPSVESEPWRLPPAPNRAGLLGERHWYLFTPTGYEPRSRPSGPAPATFPPIAMGPGPASLKITCVDVATGLVLWVRQSAGLDLSRFPDLIDPVTDDLYLCGTQLTAVDAKTGEATETKPTLPPEVLYFNLFPGTDRRSATAPARVPGMPPSSAFPAPYPGAPGRSAALVISGIARGGQYRFSRFRRTYTRRAGDSSEPSLLVYDAESRSIKTVAVWEADDSAGGLLIRAEESLAGASRADLITAFSPSGTAVWTYRRLYPSYFKPVPADGDVYALDGAPGAPSEVVRLDGQSGAVKWRFEVPGGAVGRQDIAMGRGLTVHGSHVVAVGSGGTIFVLDADTGQLTARLTVTGRLMLQPEVRGDLLLVATDEGVQGLPLAGCAAGPAQNRDAATALRARALTGLGKTAEAMLLLAPLLTRAADVAETWRAQAEICEKMSWTTEAQAAWLKYMMRTHQVESPHLRDSSGLLKLIPAGSVTADPAQIGDTVYFGSCDGSLLAIDTRTLQVTQQKVASSIERLAHKNGQLVVVDADRAEQGVRPWGEADAPPTDPAQLDDDVIPPGWSGRSPSLKGPIFCINGKYYKASVGGGIWVLDGGKMVDFQGKVHGIGAWRLYLAPQGPLGYDNSRVFSLDEHLCLASCLLDAEAEKGKVVRRFDVTSALASDGQTICFLPGQPEGQGAHPCLQIWSADGKSKLREEPLVSHSRLNSLRWKQRLFAVAGGYLLSESQLVWVSAARDVPVWRFGGVDKAATPDTPAPAVRKPPTMSDTQRGAAYPFTLPAVARRTLFVGCKEGILVFDLDRVAGRAAGALATPAAVPQ